MKRIVTRLVAEEPKPTGRPVSNAIFVAEGCVEMLVVLGDDREFLLKEARLHQERAQACYERAAHLTGSVAEGRRIAHVADQIALAQARRAS